MRRQTPRSTRTYPLFPYTTLYRALRMMDVAARDHGAAAWDVTVFDTTPLREAFGGFDAGATQLLQEFVADAVDRIAEIARHDGDAAALRPLAPALKGGARRSEEHTSELQSLMRISYAVFCLKKHK